MMRSKQRYEKEEADLYEMLLRERGLDGDDHGDVHDAMRRGPRRLYDDDDDDLYDRRMRRQRRLHDDDDHKRPMDNKTKAKKKTCKEVININEREIAVLV